MRSGYFHFQLFCLLILSNLNILNFTSVPNSTLYYSAPKFSIKNANVTFVSPKYIMADKSLENSLNYFITMGQVVAVICQADKINRKAANVSFNGVMNIAFQDYKTLNGTIQNAAMSLFSNNLYFTNNGSRLNNDGLNITGFFSIVDFGTAKINSMITNQFIIPTLEAGNSASMNPDNDFVGAFAPSNATFFNLLDSYEYDTFSAVIQLLSYFNWTMVGNIFASDSYGYEHEDQVLLYASSNKTPIFACNYIIPTSRQNQTLSAAVLDTYCDCINFKSTIQVTLLWMDTESALPVIDVLRAKCSGADKWTFVITSDYGTPFNAGTNFVSPISNTLLFRKSGPGSFDEYVEDCLANASEQAKEPIQEFIDDYTVYKTQGFGNTSFFSPFNDIEFTVIYTKFNITTFIHLFLFMYRLASFLQ